jgi:hypothetical protein
MSLQKLSSEIERTARLGDFLTVIIEMRAPGQELAPILSVVVQATFVVITQKNTIAGRQRGFDCLQ